MVCLFAFAQHTISFAIQHTTTSSFWHLLLSVVWRNASFSSDSERAREADENKIEKFVAFEWKIVSTDSASVIINRWNSKKKKNKETNLGTSRSASSRNHQFNRIIVLWVSNIWSNGPWKTRSYFLYLLLVSMYFVITFFSVRRWMLRWRCDSEQVNVTMCLGYFSIGNVCTHTHIYKNE